jgi:hypothetical protein
VTTYNSEALKLVNLFIYGYKENFVKLYSMLFIVSPFSKELLKGNLADISLLPPLGGDF